MNNKTKALAYDMIVETIMEYAADEEKNKSKDLFDQGHQLAYYEVKDIIEERTELAKAMMSKD